MDNWINYSNGKLTVSDSKNPQAFICDPLEFLESALEGECCVISVEDSAMIDLNSLLLALEDGEVLGKLGANQEDVGNLHYAVKEAINQL